MIRINYYKVLISEMTHIGYEQVNALDGLKSNLILTSQNSHKIIFFFNSGKKYSGKKNLENFF